MPNNRQLKKRYTTLLIISLLFCFNSVIAQSSYAAIEKNYNTRASSLIHELNSTKDTLLLRSTNRITQVYSINSTYKREIDLYLNTNFYELPLNNLSKGKHLLVVGESPKKIVFVIRILDRDSKVDIKETKLTYVNN